eukprot:IDg14507t1
MQWMKILTRQPISLVPFGTNLMKMSRSTFGASPSYTCNAARQSEHTYKGAGLIPSARKKTPSAVSFADTPSAIEDAENPAYYMNNMYIATERSSVVNTI